MATSLESSRAKEILQDLRKKRESLVASNPSLQKLQQQKHQREDAAARHAKLEGSCDKPPTVPRKSKQQGSKQRRRRAPNHVEKGRGAQEILGDMKRSRDSLSAVLDSYKSPASPSRRSVRTAPTAASTRSWQSSMGDDDSFCYSETSKEGDSPKESSIEFIIDTEESDLCSVSTKEEVRQAIDQIYRDVVPRALDAIRGENKRQAAVTTTTSDHASSWVFRSQSSARDLYREETVRISVSEKKKRRMKISEKRDEQYHRSTSTRSDFSYASSTNSSIDLGEVRRQRSLLKNMLDSVTELKDTSSSICSSRNNDTRSSSRSKRKETGISRRPRQDDCSEGSAPIVSKSSSGSGSMVPIEESSPKIDFDLSLFDKKPTKKKKRATSSSVASHYVLETKQRGSRTRKVYVKPKELYVAPTPDPSNMVSSDASSEGSLLVSPAASVNQELLPVVSPNHSEETRQEMTTPELERTVKPTLVLAHSMKLKKEATKVCRDEEYAKAKPSRGILRREERLSGIPEIIIATSFDVQSEVSELHIFQDSKSRDTDDISSQKPRRLTSALARASKFNPIVVPLLEQEPTPEEPQAEYIPDEYRKAEFTMDDIIREMKIISEKIGKNGLQIPAGTILNLRHSNSSHPDDMDNESSSGWTFLEPSDVSSCSYTAPSRHPSTRFTPDDEADDTPQPHLRAKKNILAEQDITERFCGGMYHLAVMSGMKPCDSSEI